MPTRRRHVAACAGLVLGTVLYAGLLVLGENRPSSFRLDPFDLGDVLVTTAPYLFVVMGTAIVFKRPEQRMGPIFLVTGLLALISYSSFEYSVAALYGSRGLPLAEEIAWFPTWSWVLMIGGFAVILLTYPTGRTLSRPWMSGFVLVGIGTVSALVGSVGLWAHRGRALFEVTIAEDSVELPGVSSTSEALLAAAPMFVVASIVVGIASVVVRFRRSSGDERQQMKGLVLASALLIVAGSVDAVAPMVGLGTASSFDVLVPLSLLGIPLAAGFAILRYRLYDIDLVINRTLVYGALTGVLALIYLGVVFVLQTLLTGIATESDLAVAASTLAVAALFRPLRARVQGFIDRRFYRQKYDAQLTLESFSSRLRDQVDLDHLAKDLTVVVREAMQPAHVSVWMRSKPTEGSRAAS